MRLPHRIDGSRAGLDVPMTPMIDVIFLLMIFFVCTVSFQAVEAKLPTPLVGQGQGAVEMPVDPELAELEEAVLALRWQGGLPHWRLGQRDYGDLPALEGDLRQLAAAQRALPVVLLVADDVPLAHVIDLYDACRLAGLEHVQFAAKAAASAP